MLDAVWNYVFATKTRKFCIHFAGEMFQCETEYILSFQLKEENQEVSTVCILRTAHASVANHAV